jgi:hypothetical protein
MIYRDIPVAMLQLERPAQAALLLLRLQKPTAVNMSLRDQHRTWLNLDGDPDQPFHMQDLPKQ